MMYLVYIIFLVAAAIIAACYYSLDRIKVSIISFGVILLSLWVYGFSLDFIKVTLIVVPLIIVSFYDVKTHHIPIAMVLVMTLAAMIIEPITIIQMFAAILFVVVFLFPFVFLSKGLGMGDIYLLIPIAIALGLPNLLYAVILGLLLFVVGVGIYVFYQHLKKYDKVKEKLNIKIAFPLGPWLSLGAIIMFFLIA